MALAIGAMVCARVRRLRQDAGELIYNDSLLCGGSNQACAPDGGKLKYYIVDRTTFGGRTLPSPPSTWWPSPAPPGWASPTW